MKIRAIMGALGAAGLLFGAAAAQAAENVTVLHWWTSGGESKAVGVLKDDLQKQGYVWKDFAVAGGAGAAAMTALKTKVISGDAPSAAQIKGPLIQEWADQGVLVNIDAAAGDWKQNLPPEIDKIIKYKGNTVAAPFSVHRVNWLYINKAALDKIGAKPPATWPEFFQVADKLKAAGIQPVAMGGQPWQDLTLWEDVVLSQGADFYRKALVELDQKTLTSDKMLEVFNTVRKIQGYFDSGRNGRDWNLATAMVINGRAGMQFMGDWAKGEFEAAGKKPGKGYICAAVPGTANAYTFNVDSFVFFQQKGQKAATPGQIALAKTIMTPAFQEQFSLLKGSIPVRLGVKMDKFDDCAKKSYADEQTAIKSGGYVPSLAHGMAQGDATAGAISDVVTKFMNSQQDAKSALAALARAAKVK
ncbi:sugar ABC transporter periplasmic substrate-binding protein [Burkholderia pseudomallei]|uniref:ABC transporter substrate-binding protein n=1 Tax=Burkholderia pseudomallei TaxID=28450 RepID=UPI0009773196|nr:ABC transporter substrate-binding protein [Burkholderia pseudomallei]OMS35544.1 sugar ABC transporter substrate-binding protein [Burkholderia pseudomallei]OMT13491.1 sugar ABC transporter substrate-binding protein [Burkholderia pseudomallei]CAJ2732978.1 sugar ABC transporter periplasmic substrate-binding protein [Burkholderia pseudomallei]CAJ4617447.1 sugar ABC transporter periplasmic substrate-binding protein [Burkholderia pseudomallei]CAJ4633258.1 sugar ABC transporter periplasmic substra